MGWVYLVHEETGGSQLVPDDAAVIAAQEARGWARAETPAEYDPDAVNTGQTVEELRAAEEAERAEAEAARLKGEALNEALEDAGLPKTGTADEKRARLAEHNATEAIPAEDPEGEVNA